MEDKELLELAAKGAGYKDAKYQEGEWMSIRYGLPFALYVKQLHDDRGNGYWNPITDDGDALRLAVELGISFCRNDELAFAQLEADPSDPDQSWGFSEELLDDPFAATRRAIVRAAAEIGRSAS